MSGVEEASHHSIELAPDVPDEQSVELPRDQPHRGRGKSPGLVLRHQLLAMQRSAEGEDYDDEHDSADPEVAEPVEQEQDTPQPPQLFPPAPSQVTNQCSVLKMPVTPQNGNHMSKRWTQCCLSMPYAGTRKHNGGKSDRLMHGSSHSTK